MMRLFRNVKDKVIPSVPSTNDCIKRVDTLIVDIERKIAELDSQLLDLKQKMTKMRECPLKNMMKQKAMRLIKRKRLYKHQVQSLRMNSLKMKQVETDVAQIRIENTDVKAVKQINKLNLLPGKLSSLCKKIVRRN